MKRTLSVILALLMMFAAFAAFTGCDKGESEKTIAVIAKGESHAFWQSVKAGAEAAGAKYGYKVTFQGPPSESPKDIPTQRDMVNSAIINKADVSQPSCQCS